MDSYEPDSPKGGCLAPTLLVLFLVGCIVYLAVTGETRLPLP